MERVRKALWRISLKWEPQSLGVRILLEYLVAIMSQLSFPSRASQAATQEGEACGQ